MQNVLRVLIVEDNESDAALVIRKLEKSGFNVIYERVQSASEMEVQLVGGKWDIVISDYSLPLIDATESLAILQKSGLDIPFIVVSGTIGEDTAVMMMKAGAQDYLMKGNLTRLAPAVIRELADAHIRSEQREATHALQESETKFRAILENSTDAIGVSLHGIHVFQNPAYLTLFGYNDQEELLGKPVIEMFAPAERARIAGYILKHTQPSAVPLDCETLGLKKDGTAFFMDFRISSFIYKSEVHSLVILRDISERKHDELALRKGYEELSIIYNTSHKLQQLTTPEVLTSDLVEILQSTIHFSYGAVLLFDQDHRNLTPFLLSSQERDTAFMQADREKIRAYEQNPEAGITGWVGKYGEPIMLGDVSKDPRYIALREDVKSELCVPLKTNEKILGVINFESVEPDSYSDSDLRIMEVLAAQMAVAIENSHLLERLREELEIRTKAELKAEESNLMKSSLMMNMSHEVRTPMNAILGFSSIIAAESEDSEIRSMADRIRVSGERLMKTLDDILELAQLQSGGNILNLEFIDVRSVLAELIPEFRTKCEQKKLGFEGTFDQTIFAKVDAHLLGKAINELLHNAIKFTDTGYVKVELVKESSVEPYSIALRISDTGIGISKAHHDAVFESFRQVSGGYGRVYEGTGLGLTIAKKIIELFDGSISVVSEEGQGSVFTVRLPGHTLDQQFKQEELPKENQQEQPERIIRATSPELPLILLVEDNEDNVFVTTEFCKNKYRVEVARNGEDAINRAGDLAFDAILMDINLGIGIDGIAATQEIKKMPLHLHTPVIAMTGFTFREDKIRILAGGCDHYIGKPFGRKELLAKLQEVLEGSSPS